MVLWVKEADKKNLSNDGLQSVLKLSLGHLSAPVLSVGRGQSRNKEEEGRSTLWQSTVSDCCVKRGASQGRRFNNGLQRPARHGTWPRPPVPPDPAQRPAVPVTWHEGHSRHSEPGRPRQRAQRAGEEHPRAPATHGSERLRGTAGWPSHLAALQALRDVTRHDALGEALCHRRLPHAGLPDPPRTGLGQPFRGGQSLRNGRLLCRGVLGPRVQALLATPCPGAVREGWAGCRPPPRTGGGGGLTLPQQRAGEFLRQLQRQTKILS